MAGCVALTSALPASPALADARDKRSLPVVRDAEIETLVSGYARPLLKAAGLSQRGIQTVLINSPDFNAFVLGRRIFVNTGAITATETPNELIGILAHEIGHLAGGHQDRLSQKLDDAKVLTLVTALLGVGVAATGAATGAKGLPGVGVGIASAGGSAVQRSLLSYMRGEETVADRAAITYLSRTGQSGRGLVETLRILQRQSAYSGVNGRSYLSSHPAPMDRIASIEDAARRSTPYDRDDPPALVERHNLARAKIAAYTDGMDAVRRMFAKAPGSLPALYGDAIATFLDGSVNSGLQKMDRLVAARPKNPWFHEMRGEMLLELGRGREAASAFRTAVHLDRSNSALLRAEVGQALIVGGNPADLKPAVQMLQASLQRDPLNAEGYRYLAMAYGRLGDIGRAELATAESRWTAGSFTEAKVFAARAQQRLQPGSPPWRRAQDILTTKTR
ncbi:M48 family metallopeptidase [Jiella sp. CQZ9-1]|uniref:M48 family metallopeptidase n=2 Tax=Jiella flava TaxID=2816857 RepID=A0A939FYC7_9HYPH|nr:M48 family metallopeptidase [Jiella flava]